MNGVGLLFFHGQDGQALATVSDYRSPDFHGLTCYQDKTVRVFFLQPALPSPDASRYFVAKFSKQIPNLLSIIRRILSLWTAPSTGSTADRVLRSDGGSFATGIISSMGCLKNSHYIFDGVLDEFSKTYVPCGGLVPPLGQTNLRYDIINLANGFHREQSCSPGAYNPIEVCTSTLVHRGVCLPEDGHNLPTKNFEVPSPNVLANRVDQIQDRKFLTRFYL